MRSPIPYVRTPPFQVHHTHSPPLGGVVSTVTRTTSVRLKKAQYGRTTREQRLYG